MNAQKKCVSFEKQWCQWGLAIGITGVLLLVTYLTMDIIFSTNDDIRIMYAVAGYNTGEPYPYHPFINYFLGKFLATLYEMWSHVPWYGYFHVFCLFLGVTIIAKCLIKVSVDRKKGIVLPLFLHVFMYYAIFIFSVVCMQFSTTSAVLGGAAIALSLSFDIQKDKKSYVYFALVLSGLLMIVCFMIRSFTWYCMMCFYLLALFYQMCRVFLLEHVKRSKWIRVYASFLAIMLIIILGSREISLYLKEEAEENKTYSEYNEFRTEFQDYNMYLDYNSNEEFYQELGWSKNIFQAVKGGLLFLEESLNAETLSVITNAYKDTADQRDLSDVLNTATKVVINNRVAKSGIATILLLAIAAGIVIERKQEKLVEKICALLAFVGFCLIYIMLAYRGRLPIRIFMVVSIPVALYLSISYLKLIDIDYCEINNNKILGNSICILMMIIVMLYNINAIYCTDECMKVQTSTTATKEEVLKFEQYAMKNKDNIYVYDFSVATVQREPFVAYPEQKPTNCIISGGSYTFSTLYFKQLKLNNMESLYWEDMLRENIYFVSAREDFVDLTLLNIKEKVGENIRHDIVESFSEEGIKVYKFSIENQEIEKKNL